MSQRMRLHKRVFATLSDAKYFPGLWALLNSIYVYHGDELRVFVFSYGLTPAQLRRLEKHPLVIETIDTREFSVPAEGPWEAKQQIMAYLIKRAECVYLLDCDLVLTSGVEDVFTLAEEGKIVSSLDGHGVDFANEYRTYQPRLVGQAQCYVNSGALCFNVQRHWDLAGLWAFSSQFGSYSPSGGWPLHLPGHGDQGVFNALCALLGKATEFALLPEAEWCDSTQGCALRISDPGARWQLRVENLNTGKVQRLVHSTGPKWWTGEGRKALRRQGDKYAIFKYFANVLPRVPRNPKPGRRPKQPKILVGICTHAENRAARDAVRTTWKAVSLEGITVRFFAEQGAADERDVISLPASDRYAALPSKVQAFFRHAIEHEEFDYLFKCDDDTYVVLERLWGLVSTEAEIVGDRHVDTKGWCSGGAGYLLSKDTVQCFASAYIPPEGAEDIIFSKLAHVYGRKMKADSRLRADARVLPMSGNELITAHRLNPEAMREVHQVYESSFPLEPVER